MLEWPQDSEEIARRIRRAPAPVKLLLKTLDEPLLLPKWIEHHARIVGLENLIVADNGSGDPGVLALYESIGDVATVFRFGGFHNFVHDRSRFPELYAAVGDAARWVMALDTDELLIRTDGESWAADPSILAGLSAGEAYAAAYLYNAPGRADAAEIPANVAVFRNHTGFGKPLVPAAFRDEGVFIHTVQYPADLFGADSFPNLFILHLTRYSVAQRLNSNRNKLAARGFVAADADFSAIALKDPAPANDVTVTRCVGEIRALLAAKDAGEPPLPPLWARFLPDGAVRFGDDRARAAFLGYVNEPPDARLAQIRSLHEKWSAVPRAVTADRG